MEQTLYSKDKKYKLEVFRNEDAESPDIWRDDSLFLVYDHRQFAVVREGFSPDDIYEYLEDCHEQIENDLYDEYYIFPVDAYIHSGTTLSLANTRQYPDRKWDVSTNGYVMVEKSSVTPDEDSTTKWNPEELAKGLAEGLIKNWNTYLSGDVWGYSLYKKEMYYSLRMDSLSFEAYQEGEINIFPSDFKEQAEWDEVDSCSGFYGNDIKTNGILDFKDEYGFEIE